MIAKLIYFLHGLLSVEEQDAVILKLGKQEGGKMNDDINRELHLALGLDPLGQTLIPPMSFYPDYCDDPRLVIEAMRERLSKDDFEDWLCECNKDDVYRQIDVDLIMDKTGKLAKLAMEWIRRGRK